MNRHRTPGELAGLGDLPPRKRDRVRSHLAGCQRCRDELTFVREARQVARSATSPAATEAGLATILARRRAGDRVILPVDAPAAQARRRVAPAAAVAASLILAVAIAAQFVATRLQGPEPGPATTTAPPGSAADPPVGIAIVPSAPEAEIAVVGTGPIRLEVTRSDGPELGVRGRDGAVGARFRAAGGGISVSELTGGTLEASIPFGVITRIYVNGVLEVTADSLTMHAHRTGETGDRLILDLAP